MRFRAQETIAVSSLLWSSHKGLGIQILAKAAGSFREANPATFPFQELLAGFRFQLAQLLGNRGGREA